MPDGSPPSRFDLQLAFRVQPDVANKLFAVKAAIEQQKLQGSKIPLSMVCKIALANGLEVMMAQYGVKEDLASSQAPASLPRRKRSRQAK